eukprot:scaffold301845_cov27-Tisochrysis_lutea.AAC.1
MTASRTSMTRSATGAPHSPDATSSTCGCDVALRRAAPTTPPRPRRPAERLGARSRLRHPRQDCGQAGHCLGEPRVGCRVAEDQGGAKGAARPARPRRAAPRRARRVGPRAAAREAAAGTPVGARPQGEAQVLAAVGARASRRARHPERARQSGAQPVLGGIAVSRGAGQPIHGSGQPQRPFVPSWAACPISRVPGDANAMSGAPLAN